ncbi:sortase B [Hydrogenoanaerobacterium saccharovorans]|uniref:Sortase B n=1 Tax=Hydrogenoanaerobacterium saccharovorans TaxID=474960 RepID=A0A1H8D2I4_9FIRM|nr:class B sortase [Hydrogenoanaerobacterium saccharovorans]RPF43421.1 sortase B [Hydrogenoanaerobacterium saccharovorans]SEN00788.1 sortase B [Hydrogenoanaerobacterium saccharovorans]
MNKRTRILCLVFAAVMLLSFASCSKKTDASSQGETPVSTYTFYNPLTEPAYIANDNTPVEPDKTKVEKINEYKAKNKETVGWLTIPGTLIDDIVFQDPNGNEKYMRLDNNGKWALEGCFFADYRIATQNRASLGKNTIIYGHNLNDDKKNGVRFAQLMNYTDLEYAKAHPYIHFTTAEDEMVFKVFAAFYTETAFDYIKTKFNDVTQFTDLVKEARTRSEHNFDVNVTASDKIITLSTCTYKFGGVSNKQQRFVVMGRLLHTGEKDTDPVNAVKNPSPKAPKFK